MGFWRSFVSLAITAAWIGFQQSPAEALAFSPNADDLESPKYTMIYSESDYEIRKYDKTAWITAHERDKSFLIGTYKGFHKIFQYIEGANLNSSHVPMTSPILTGIVPSSGSSHAPTIFVRLYLSISFQKSPPVALPELKLKVERWEEQCIATRKFSGFATDSKVAKELSKLFASLGESPWKYAFSKNPASGHDAYSVAQYRMPFQILHRANEVWVALASNVSDDCLPNASLHYTSGHESV